MTTTPTQYMEALSVAKAEREAEEVAAIRVGLEASDAGRVRPVTEVAAEKRAMYHLPIHLSDTEIFSGEEGGTQE